MPSQIEPSGVVSRIVGDTVHVTITAHSACGSCRARQAGGLGATQGGGAEVRTTPPAPTARGDAVVVGVRRRAGGIAVLLAYVGALVVLLAVLAVAAGPLHWSEGHAALAALAGVALYYVVLWLFRKRIEHTIQFTITKI